MKRFLIIGFLVINCAVAMDSENMDQQANDFADKYTEKELLQKKESAAGICNAIQHKVNHLPNDPSLRDQYNQFWNQQLTLQQESILLGKALEIKKRRRELCQQKLPS